MRGKQKMDTRGARNRRWVGIHPGDRRRDGTVKEAEGGQKVTNETVHRKPGGKRKTGRNCLETEREGV